MRLAWGGCETLAAADLDPDGFVLNGTAPTADTTHQSDGAGCYAYANPGSARSIQIDFTEVDDATYYFKFRFRFSANPAVNVNIAAVGQSSSAQKSITLTTAGQLQGPGGGVTSILTPGTWYCVEMSVNRASAGTHATVTTYRLDESQFDTNTADFANASTWFRVGAVSLSGSISADLFFDDIVLNDSTGADNNTWPGKNSRIVCLVPTADNVIGSNWALGTGTAPGGAAWDAVNNKPPNGVANGTAGSDTKQIRDTAATQGTNDDADFTMQTYNTAGVPAGATVKLLRSLAYFSDSSSTLLPTTKLRIVSNPAEGSDTNGANTGSPAAGAWRSGWRVTRGPQTVVPSVVLGTAPVVRVGRADTVAATLLCCFIGIMVEYEPASGPTTGQLWPRGWKDASSPTTGQLFPRRVIT